MKTNCVGRTELNLTQWLADKEQLVSEFGHTGSRCRPVSTKTTQPLTGVAGPAAVGWMARLPVAAASLIYTPLVAFR